MKIFEKRPLSLILCVMLTVFSLFIESGMPVKISVFTGALLLFVASFIPKLFYENRRSGIRALAIASAVSMLISIIWSLTFFPTGILGENKNVEGKVSDITEYTNYSKLTVSCKTVNGKAANAKISLYYYYSTPVDIDDEISFTAALLDVREYADEDSLSYYYSDGISTIATDISNLAIAKDDGPTPGKYIRALRENISDTLAARTDKDTGGFLSALLIGDRTNLDPNTSLSFKRLGISHILALSGMHLTIITHALERILRLLSLHKKARIGISAVFTVGYMALAGFTPSITRSGLMLLIYYLLFFIARRQDSITSLFISVAAIVFISPCSVFDISLWLSAFATLGVIISASVIERRAGKATLVKRAFAYAFASCFSSFFAISCTLLITVLIFGSVSLLSIITTLIFSIPTTLLIYFGFILLFFGGIMPLGIPITAFTDLTKELADAMSSPSWALASSNYIGIKVLTIIFTVFLVAFLVLDIKRRKPVLSALIVMFISIFLISGISTAYDRSRDDAYTYVSKEKDIVLIKSHSRAYLIPGGDASASVAYQALDVLNNEHLTYLDELILTSLSKDFAYELYPLINNIRIGIIRIPNPTTEAELAFCEDLATLLSKYGTTLRFYDERLGFGEYSFELLYRTEYVEETSSEAIYTISIDNISCGYLTEGAHPIAPLSVISSLSKCDIIILGASGSKDKPFNLYLDGAEYIIVNGSCQISEDTQNYYDERHTRIYYNKTQIDLFK